MMRTVFLALFGALALAQVPEEGSDAALFGQHGGQEESDVALYGGQAQESTMEESSNQEEAGADNSKESDQALYAHNTGDFQAESDAALYGAALLQDATKKQAPEAGSDLALFGENGGESESDAALYGGQAQEEQASTQEEAGADNSKESDVALYAHNSADYAADSDAALYGASFLQVQTVSNKLSRFGSGDLQAAQLSAPKKLTLLGQVITKWGAAPKIASLPEQGYEGKKVKHQNMRTITSDWGCEYGAKCKKSGAQGATVAVGLAVMAMYIL